MAMSFPRAGALSDCLTGLTPWPAYAWLGTVSRLLVLGATVGASLDGIHTHLGVTAYPEPWLWLMARWVPLLFAGASLGFGLVPPIVERLLTGRMPVASWGRVLVGVGIFIASYAASGLLAQSWAMCTWLLAFAFAIVWWLLGARAVDLWLSVFGAAIGVAFEMSLVHAHAFWYVRPDVGGVPVWLPWLYAIGVASLGHLGRKWLLGGIGR